MRATSILSLGILLTLLGGCKETDAGLEREHAINVWMVNTLKNNAVENAIISQRTLYAYHFVPDSPKLNELGYADLQVLASQFRRAPGTLYVRKSETPEELYEARVGHVKELLAAQGVDLSEVAIVDGIAGGDGNPSERVRWALEKERSAASAAEAEASSGEEEGVSMRGVSR